MSAVTLHRQPALVEVLSAFSWALDLVEGQPEGHAVRTARIVDRIAVEMRLPLESREHLLYASLLKDAGCSNNSARIQKIFGGDDHLNKYEVKFVDWSKPLESLKYGLTHTEAGRSLGTKLRRMLGNLKPPQQIMDEVTEARCTRGAEIARELGFPEEVARAIHDLDEHWDGKGSPAKKRGEEIPLEARLLCLGQTFEVFATTFGPDAAYAMLRERSGRWFQPEIVRAAESFASDHAFWSEHACLAADPTSAYLPDLPMRSIDTADTDRVCRAFARIVDAKSPYTAEHSSRVTHYAVEIAQAFSLDPVRIETIRRAGLLHDLGKLGVPNSILDKPGRLDEQEFQRVRRHPGDTFRIVGQIAAFSRIGEVAAAHHERLDGKGYWRGLDADRLDLDMRILAVADVFDAISADRPYRPAMPIERVFAILEEESGTGLDADCVTVLRELYGPQSARALPTAA